MLLLAKEIIEITKRWPGICSKSYLFYFFHLNERSAIKIIKKQWGESQMDQLNKEEIYEKQEMYYALIESREKVKKALKLLGEWSNLYVFSNDEDDKATLEGIELAQERQRTQLDNIEKTMKNIRASISMEELKSWKREAENRNALPEAI